MKLFFPLLIFLPYIGTAQTGLNKIILLDGKVQFSAPKELSPITDEAWKVKYHDMPKPTLALSDEAGEINLIVDLTKQPATEDQLDSYRDFRVEKLKKTIPDIKILSDSVKSVNGRKIGYIKFISQASDQNIFNYYFFIVANGKILFFTFNCIETLQKPWESEADKIIESLRIK